MDDGDALIYIMVGNKVCETTRADFEKYILDQYPYEYLADVTKDLDFYDDAYDWLLSNLKGALSIQLYADDVIRINYEPYLFPYRCEFFDDALLADETFNDNILQVIKDFCAV